MEPEISIIIPTLNEESKIGSLLGQIQKLSGNSVREVITADGGSSDRTAEIARENGAKVIECPKPGRAFQMNQGAKQASGNILFFLHADTVPPQNFDELIYNEIEGGAGSGCFRLSFDWDHPALKFYGWFTRFNTTLVRFGDQGLFAKKELFQTINGYDESLLVMEDQQIVRNLKMAGPFSVIENNVVTSARKYRDVGVIKLQAIFFLIWTGYYLGIEQNALVHFYKSSIDQSQI